MISLKQSQVVVRLPDETLKGYLSEGALEVIEASADDLETISIQLLESGETSNISLSEAKAIFFVKSFEGQAGRADLRFHDGTTPAPYLWVRLTFLDGEVLEGMIDNSYSFVAGKGIWVTPTDPTGNNWLIYTLKSQLKHFEVLGMRLHAHRRVSPEKS